MRYPSQYAQQMQKAEQIQFVGGGWGGGGGCLECNKAFSIDQTMCPMFVSDPTDYGWLLQLRCLLCVCLFIDAHPFRPTAPGLLLLPC